MANTKSSFERIALNRVTFGARDVEVTNLQREGWSAWVERQLLPPQGDDPALAAHIKSQVLHIQYDAFDDNLTNYHWKAVNEDRPLNYLSATPEQIWKTCISIPWTLSFSEDARMWMEFVSGVYIRNAHSAYQLREFMADFWLNHFSIGYAKGRSVYGPAIVYDRDVIRPNVFGNFRTLLEAVTASTSMLNYLDNAGSTAAIPNENYARELMELHTMGRDAYFGKNPGGADVSAKGFTDEDILQASRALSGWTIGRGQTNILPGVAASSGVIIFPDDGQFVFNPGQHNDKAGRFLGFDLSAYSGIAQGRKVLDIISNHAATAPFICGKLCRRIFGDTPPQAVLDRAIATWIANRNAPDQIARVLRAILLEGPEIGTGPTVKVRRPYERFIAMVRATDTVLNASMLWPNMFQTLQDSPLIWPTPDGRPDTNAFWLTTYVNVTVRDQLQQITPDPGVLPAPQVVSIYAQTPTAARQSVTAIVDYWVERLVGGLLSDEAMQALYAYAGQRGVPTENYWWAYWEADFVREIITTIASSPEFVMR